MKLSFDASKVEPIVGFEVVPAGKYEAALESCEERANAEGTGSHLAVMLNILSGKYEGRKLFTNLNIENESEKAQKFAFGTLSAICHATGVMQMEDTDELIGIPLVADVRVTQQKTFGKKNVINAFTPVGTVESSDEASELI